MLGGDGRAGHEGGRHLHRDVRGHGLDARRGITHAAATLFERSARALGALELVPLRRERAPDVGDERGGLGASPRDDRLSPVLGRGRRLRGFRELCGGLGPNALDLARALGVRAGVGVERRQQVGEPDGVLGAVRRRPRDQLGVEAEARGDRQRVALAGLVVAQPEGRRQRRGVELDRGVTRARMGGRERLERLEVGRRDHERTTAGQLLEDRLRERRALVRIRPGAELVQEHQRALVGRVEDLADLLDEGREGREVLGDRLVVADDREDVVEHG